MATIKYQTDNWGGDKGRHHLEIDMNGNSVMMDIEDSRIHINGFCVRIDQVAMNAVDVFIEPQTSNAAGQTPAAHKETP